ncbi:hypothetical protein ACYZT8_05145 [Pseudomonas sp. LB3P93]
MTKAIAPSIYKVTDHNGEELPNGGTTSRKSVSVYGKTGVGQVGVLKNGDDELANFEGGSDMRWKVDFNVTEGTYKLRATSGDGTSPERVFFVIKG